jgi:alpha-1,3-mannosyltransferase
MLDVRWSLGCCWDYSLCVSLYQEWKDEQRAEASMALGVKMNILLFLPGAWVMLFQIRGLGGMLESTAVIALIQVRLIQHRRWGTDDQLVLAYPFIINTPDISRGYFTSSFNFSRQFLYEWTVNWRFIPENVFLSKEFSNNLLFFHVRPPPHI